MAYQLGLGVDTEEQATPSRVRWKGADDWFVEDASAGGQHCFLLASERVRFFSPRIPMHETDFLISLLAKRWNRFTSTAK